MISHSYIESLKTLLEGFPHQQFESMMDEFFKAYEAGRRIFIMGNGGSASTASHWACDINKGCCENGNPKRFRVMCLNDNVATMLAYANDLCYEDIFVEQIKNFFESGDLVIAISGSGNSKNVLKAVAYANAMGGVTVGLCGFSGGELGKLAQIPLHIRANDMQQVEDLHLIIAHMSMQRIMSTQVRHGEACS